MEGKKRLTSKLLMAMDKDVKDSLVMSAGHQAAYNAFNINMIWNLTEQFVVGGERFQCIRSSRCS